MQLLRFLIVCIILGSLAFFLGRVVIRGLKTGKIAHTDSSSFCLKKQNPIRFWLFVIFFSGIILCCLYIIGISAYKTITY
jgi:hypothetical protein